MATRPWVTPEEVIEYTDFEKVKTRSTAKLQADIVRAENYIIHRTNNTFQDNEKYPEIPSDIKLATMLIAEFYANTATQDPQKRYQSETYKDYSYTISGGDMSVDDIDISALISPYVLKQAVGNLDMKLRKL
jgi:hypothetical protein